MTFWKASYKGKSARNAVSPIGSSGDDTFSTSAHELQIQGNTGYNDVTVAGESRYNKAFDAVPYC